MNAVDTNVLFYAHDSRDPNKQKIAAELIASLNDGALLWQVACEYLWASRKLEAVGYSPGALSFPTGRRWTGSMRYGKTIVCRSGTLSVDCHVLGSRSGAVVFPKNNGCCAAYRSAATNAPAYKILRQPESSKLPLPAKSLALRESVRLQLYADLFNTFNIGNVAFISASAMPNNPAFIYGLGVLPTGAVAPVDPRFMRLRTVDGRNDPGTTAQQGTPFQAQLGVRLLF
jgi:hypothetical protein